MPEVWNKILKFTKMNHKSLKIPFVITIQHNNLHQKQTNVRSVVIHYSHTIHFVTTKASIIFTEVKAV